MVGSGGGVKATHSVAYKKGNGTVDCPPCRDDEVATVLRLAEYGGEEEGSWVLLEPVALAAAAGQ